MDIDATRAASSSSSSSKKTLFSFRRDMRGRCYGCGSKDHTKAQGKHDREVCNHCSRTGHRAIVCMDKYLGKPGKGAARVGASTQGSASDASEETAAVLSPAHQDMLSKMIKQQAELAKAVEALKKAF